MIARTIRAAAAPASSSLMASGLGIVTVARGAGVLGVRAGSGGRSDGPAAECGLACNLELDGR